METTPKQTYYERHRDSILARAKAYRENNPEKHHQTCREWYEKNKDEYLARKNRKTECECGKTISWNNRHEHYRSKYHQAFINKDN